ncbi:MFS transporter [Rhodococcoides kyotonense]|uniref:Sugar phosphate permease n=1 Tax=Rhodococcoides kyotonense TaxID=398843 RepID=A0A239N3F6_9NOCA|nr:MFS transporter [Rhodococcus kyotonensis]SNT49405.1 Sugar phosphate permease [Rhodococcus kyotonensis]
MFDEETERRLWRKIGFRIIPLVGIAYIISYIDRANLGYIAKPMSADLGMTTAQLGLAAGLFFIGYILVEVPSNMMLRRFGARIWISRIIISWGIVTALTGAVHSATQLYIARVILGFAEAGLAAGILLFLTFWFPKKQRAWAMSAFFLCIPLSSIIGAPIAAALLQWGETLLGIAGWRSLFVVEGILTVLIGVVILIFLPDRPSKAKWLSQEEKSYLGEILAAEAAAQVHHGAMTGMRQALTNGRTWALSIAFFAIVFGLYPLAFFLPTMIENLSSTIGSAANVSSVLLAAIPSAVAIVVMILWSRVAGRRSAVFSTTIPMAFGAVGLVGATFTQNGVLFIIAVCVSISGIYTAMPQFWRIPALSMTGAAAAAGIALINSVSNLSGFVGPYVTGAIETATGSYTYALLTITVVIMIGIAILLTVGRRAEALGTRADDETPTQTADTL